MNLKLRLSSKSKSLRKTELGKNDHSFWHWWAVLFFTFTKGILFGLVGFLLIWSGLILFKTKSAWFSLALGLPLVLTGTSIVFIQIYQILAVILDRRYSRSHCPFCAKA